MSREERRTEGEIESGIRIWSEHVLASRQTTAATATGGLTLHSPSLLSIHPLLSSHEPIDAARAARCHLDLDSGPSSVLSAAPGAPSPLDDFSLGVGTEAISSSVIVIS